MLSIIIVNYKQTELVRECIRSIYSNTHSIRFEIILVDNSQDGRCKIELEQEFPLVKIIDTGCNIGFARANNIGMYHALGDMFLLLNSDTLVMPGSIDYSEMALRKSSFAACGVQLLNEDGTRQVSGHHFTPGNFGIFLKLPYIKQLYNFIKKDKDTSQENIELIYKKVQWINGAFLMVKKSVVESAGWMDEDFFLYSEETEWCSRLGKQGDLVIFLQANVVHLQGGSFENEAGKGYYGVFDRRGLQLLISEFLRTRKQYGIFCLLLQYVAFICYVPFLFCIVCLHTLIKGARTTYTLTQWKGFLKNVVQCSPYIWRMVLGKPFFYKVL